MAAQIVFWVAAGLLAFTYLGYPLLLQLLVLIKGRPVAPAGSANLPRVSALVVAFNEEQGIIRKIENILQNGYPGDKIEVVVCSDGSTDGTNRLVDEYGDPRVRLAASPVNVGVNEAFAIGVKQATGEVYLMTDSGGGMFQEGAIEVAARHFADAAVGLVSGNIHYENPDQSAIGSGYHSYWFIETGVRQLESDLGYSIVTVGIFEMIRKEAYLPVPSQFNNDMSAPVYAYSLGYKCRYEPRALAVAQQKKTPRQDMGRRIRMAVRGWSSMPFISRHVPFFRNIRIWLALISHKYLRWSGGFFLLAVLAANVFLLDNWFYRITLAGQLAFYGAALGGWLLALMGKRLQPFSLCFYFCLLQIGGLVGLIQTLCGRRIGAWKPVD